MTSSRPLNMLAGGGGGGGRMERFGDQIFYSDQI